MLIDLVDDNLNRATLFEHKDNTLTDKLMRSIDKINKSQGANTVFFAAQGIRRHWAMKCDHRSSKYTTNWQELPQVT